MRLSKMERGNDVASVVLAHSSDAQSRRRSRTRQRSQPLPAYKARLKIFAVALDQGVSIGELGRAWAISRHSPRGTRKNTES